MKYMKYKSRVSVVKKELANINFADRGSLCFKAGVILYYMMDTGIRNPWMLSKLLKYDINDVFLIFSNWMKNGVYEKGVFLFENKADDRFFTDRFFIETVLIAMVGSGDLLRQEAV